MKSDICVLEEPKLVFGDGNKLTDPHAGLSLFGPYDKGELGRPRDVSYALIGGASGLRAFKDFVRLLKGPLFHEKLQGGDVNIDIGRLWPPYPGFGIAFDCDLPEGTRFEYEIADNEIMANVNDVDQHKRVFKIVNLYLEKIKMIAERDENIKVVICVEPDLVWKNCRPKSTIRRDDATGSRVTAKEITELRKYAGDLFGSYEEDQYDYSIDFRRQLKARVMKYRIPVQLIRESTLSLHGGTKERKLTPLSDRAWNLSTALYYKAGGRPWKLAGARDGVCYIGLTFRCSEDNRKDPRTACCAAQMFLDTGDGVVFHGEFGPWYSPDTNEFHLSRDMARLLLKGVIETYERQGGKSLKEVFLHARSGFTDEELRGYQEACPDGVKLIGVRVTGRNKGVRMLRAGEFCVQRGTLWIHNKRTAYLWASGFKTDLLTYDGWEIPSPIEIRVVYGDADIKQVSRDILGLTKLNYNACKIGDALPVTVAFSDKVGEILISNPTVKQRLPNFRFYI